MSIVAEEISLGSGPSFHFPYVGAGLRPGIEARFSNIGALRLQADAITAVDRVHVSLGQVQTGISRLSLGLGVAGMILF